MVNSDGLSGVLRDAEMERIISENSQSMSSCRSALWAAAERADWYDNVTAILCEITEGAEYSPALEGIEDKDLNKSFFNLRVSKKGLKLVLAGLVIILAGVICFFSARSCKKDNPEGPITEEEPQLIEGIIKEDTIQTPVSEPKTEVNRSRAIDKKDNKEPLATYPELEERDTAKQVAPENDVSDVKRRRLTPAENSGGKPIDNGNPFNKKKDSTSGEENRLKLTPVPGSTPPNEALPKSDTTKISI